jgi:adenylate cyclase
MPDKRTWLAEITLSNKDLTYKLSLIVGIFFILPVFGFLFFAIKYSMLEDHTVSIFLSAFLAFSFFGFLFLRSIFGRVSKISRDVSEKVTKDLAQTDVPQGADELSNIAESFKAMENYFKTVFEPLERKVSKIATLKELSELCCATYDPEEILYVTLERALKLVDGDIGSILMLDPLSHHKSFIVKANIGLADFLKVGDRVDFETSIAKYAVINHSPLVVNDIEKDSRFGRNNRPIYRTKSFICMPIKTTDDVIGVLSLSRRESDKPFIQDDVEMLTPLLSSGTFTYENLVLIKENQEKTALLKSAGKIFGIINSSLKNSELIHAILKEIQGLLSFDRAVILLKDEDRPEDLVVFDFLSQWPANLSKGTYSAYKGSTLDQVLKQGTTVMIDDMNTLSEDMEKEFFANHEFRSCVLAPLKIEGTTSGLLAFYAREPAAFQLSRTIIGMGAECLAFALEKNRLFATLTKRGRQLDTLKQIGNALTLSTFDIDQVLKYTMDMIHAVMNVQAGTLFLLQQDELEFKVAFGADAGALNQYKLKIGQGIAGHVASQGKPVIVNDVKQSPHFFAGVDSSTGFTTRSVLCVPMISQGKVLGVIELINKLNGDFGTSDEQLLESVVSSLTIAIENARLYQKMVAMTEHERGIRQMFQKFVPEEIVEKIIHGEESGKAILDEFRTVTLLNLDIRGFSRLATKLGPQKTVALLNYFFSAMGGIVFNHHGIVDKYLGDGFLAVFGAPVPSSMDADNAVSAALEMQHSIETISDYFVQEIGAPLVVGISIHTGEVVIGNIGFEKKMDYTVIGDSVNTVFRLQLLTKDKPNCALLSENTRRATRSRIDARELGTYEIDSNIGAIKVYELLGQENNHTP